MNLVIDGNAFLNVSLNIVKQMMFQDRTLVQNYWVEDLVGDGFILKDGAKALFKDFTFKYLHSIVSMHPALNTVFIPFDSKSWRKDYLTEASLDQREIDYKGQRKHDDKQYLFFEYFRLDLLAELASTNIEPFRVPRAEGDDIVARLIERYPEEDFCIWSTDLDFFQLLTNSPRLIILSTPKMGRKTKNVYSALNYQTKIKDQGFDIFDFSHTDNIDSILEFTRKGHTHQEVNPHSELIGKLVAGDKSDNIPRAHKGMTPKKVDIIVESTLIDYPNFTKSLDENPVEVIRYLAQGIASLLKIKDEKDITDLKHALKTNVIIIRLNSKFFPKDILKTIDDSINRIEKRPFIASELKKRVKY